METFPLVIKNIGQLLTLDPELGEGRLGIVEGGAIIFSGARVTWAGRNEELPSPLSKGAEEIDAHGRVLMPGLIDPHTHLIFGGSREREFSLRMEGRSYHEILTAGGGILSTVEATRKASSEELLRTGIRRCNEALSFGVTTIEIKSGYGLNLHDEIRCLRVVREIARRHPLSLVPTLLAGHAIPPEFKGKRKDYVRLIMDEIVPAASSEGLARFCDVFCEESAFTLEEAEAILQAGLMAGLKAKIHTEQFTRRGGVDLAVRLRATSCDHLERIDEGSIELLLKNEKTVAVLLPGTSLFLREPYAPARRLLDRGVRVALGTNFNPGSSPTQNLPLMGSLACLQMGMTCEEAILAMTLNAARALDIEDEAGSLAPGKRGDALLLDAFDYRALLVNYGQKITSLVVKDGRPVYRREGGDG